MLEDEGTYFIEEGDGYTSTSRFITGESHVKPSTRVIEYSNYYKITIRDKEKIFDILFFFKNICNTLFQIRGRHINPPFIGMQ